MQRHVNLKKSDRYRRELSNEYLVAKSDSIQPRTSPVKFARSRVQIHQVALLSGSIVELSHRRNTLARISAAAVNCISSFFRYLVKLFPKAPGEQMSSPLGNQLRAHATRNSYFGLGTSERVYM